MQHCPDRAGQRVEPAQLTAHAGGVRRPRRGDRVLSRRHEPVQAHLQESPGGRLGRAVAANGSRIVARGLRLGDDGIGRPGDLHDGPPRKYRPGLAVG